jgi:predicted lactoylglutathione lyase
MRLVEDSDSDRQVLHLVQASTAMLMRSARFRDITQRNILEERKSPYVLR